MCDPNVNTIKTHLASDRCRIVCRSVRPRARVMLRGLRTLSDMEYEFSMSLTNLALDGEIETVFLMANEAYSHISSTLIRQIATFQGDLAKFVPPEIKVVLDQRAWERENGRP